MVAPFTGAWIEIARNCVGSKPSTSLPSRERGLKSVVCDDGTSVGGSLPSRERGLKFQGGLDGALDLASLPSRERGLKFVPFHGHIDMPYVAPFTGAWIEITWRAQLGLT